MVKKTAEPVQFGPDRLLHLTWGVVWAAASVAGFFAFDPDNPFGWFIVGLAALFALRKIVVVLPGATRLTIGEDGFVLRRLYVDHVVSWQDIGEPFSYDWFFQITLRWPYAKQSDRTSGRYWLRRFFIGRDDLFYVWNFNARYRTIRDALQERWRRARLELKNEYWQPDQIVFEPDVVWGLPFLVAACWWPVRPALTTLMVVDHFNFIALIVVISWGAWAVSLAFQMFWGNGLILRRNEMEIRAVRRTVRIRWRDMDKPHSVRISDKWPFWHTAVMCQIRADRAGKMGWPYEASRVVTFDRVYGLSWRTVLYFLTVFWLRGQQDATPLDPASSKD